MHLSQFYMPQEELGSHSVFPKLGIQALEISWKDNERKASVVRKYLKCPGLAYCVHMSVDRIKEECFTMISRVEWGWYHLGGLHGSEHSVLRASTKPKTVCSAHCSSQQGISQRVTMPILLFQTQSEF